MKSILKKFPLDNRGSFYISDLFSILIVMSLILSFIYIPPMFTTHTTLDYVCYQIAHAIEIHGKYDANVIQLIDELKTATGLDFSVSISGNFVNISGEQRIQLNESFTVTVDYTYEVKLFEPSFTNEITLDVPLKVTKKGISQTYWRAGEI